MTTTKARVRCCANTSCKKKPVESSNKTAAAAGPSSESHAAPVTGVAELALNAATAAYRQAFEKFMAGAKTLEQIEDDVDGSQRFERDEQGSLYFTRNEIELVEAKNFLAEMNMLFNIHELNLHKRRLALARKLAGIDINTVDPLSKENPYCSGWTEADLEEHVNNALSLLQKAQQRVANAQQAVEAEAAR